jgi:hypothetical protein
MADRAEFDRCWQYLEPALGTPPTHRKEDIWSVIEAGRAIFWPMAHSALVHNYLTHPTGLKDANVWLAGGDWDEIRTWIGPIEDFMRQRADRVLIRGRPGFQRVLKPYGYRVYGVQLVKEL